MGMAGIEIRDGDGMGWVSYARLALVIEIVYSVPEMHPQNLVPA